MRAIILCRSKSVRTFQFSAIFGDNHRLGSPLSVSNRDFPPRPCNMPKFKKKMVEDAFVNTNEFDSPVICLPLNKTHFSVQ